MKALRFSLFRAANLSSIRLVIGREQLKEIRELFKEMKKEFKEYEEFKRRS
jgi:hypothetical protein